MLVYVITFYIIVVDSSRKIYSREPRGFGFQVFINYGGEILCTGVGTGCRDLKCNKRNDLAGCCKFF